MTAVQAGAQCLGDFNGDGRVSVDELVTAIDNSLNDCSIGALRFIDNGDGTITDHQTGLAWEKKDGTCPGIHCYRDVFAWSTCADNSCAAEDTYPPSGAAFTTFLYGLNGGASSDGQEVFGCFAGHCDWRLPTIDELAGIVDRTQGNCGGENGPCISSIFGPTQSGCYWSSTSLAGSPGGAWDLDFDTGLTNNVVKTAAQSVRAVRRVR